MAADLFDELVVDAPAVSDAPASDLFDDVATDPVESRKSSLRAESSAIANSPSEFLADTTLGLLDLPHKLLEGIDRAILPPSMPDDDKAAADEATLSAMPPKSRALLEETVDRARLLDRIRAVNSPVSTGLRDSAIGGIEAMSRPSGVAILGATVAAPTVMGPVIATLGVEGAKDAIARMKEARSSGDRSAYYHAAGDVLQSGGMVVGGAGTMARPIARSFQRPTLTSPADVPAIAAELERVVDPVSPRAEVPVPEVRFDVREPVAPEAVRPAEPATTGDAFDAALEAEAARAQSGLDAGTRTAKDPIPPVEAATADATAPTEPQSPGMGAMAAGELTPSPATPTSIRNATVDAERAQRGLPPATAAARQTFGTVWDEALATLDRDPGVTDRLLAELRTKPRSLTAHEDALLLHRQVDLQNEFGKATRDLARAYEDGQAEVAAAEQVRVNLFLDQLRDLYDTGKRAGTETARGLAARRMFANEDFTLSSMQMAKRAANEGRPLTPKESADTTKLHDQIAELQRKLAEALAAAEAKATRTRKPSDAPKKPNPALDPDVLKASRELDLARSRWHENLTRDRYNQLTTREKVFHHAFQTYDAFRTLITSFEFSAVLRQGKFILAGHPLMASRSLKPMFAALNRANHHELAVRLANRPNASRYRDSGLYIAEHGSPLTRLEEGYMSNLADKIPGVAASQRAYTTFLNQLRADAFDAMSNALPRGRKATPLEDASIAKFINQATGRGSLGALEPAAVGLSRVFFSPRYVASRFQLILGALRVAAETATGFQTVPKNQRAVRRLIATEYARTLAGYAAFYTLAKMALPDSEVETDPRSSDAGKVKIGNTRLDPLAGLQQSTVLLSRLGTGETKTLKGRVTPIRGERVPFGGTTSADVMTRFLRSKLAPVPGAVVNAITGEDVTGQPVTAASTAKSLLVPIAYQDILAAMEDQGIPRGTALGILSIFGEGVQVYNDERRR